MNNNTRPIGSVVAGSAGGGVNRLAARAAQVVAAEVVKAQGNAASHARRSLRFSRAVTGAGWLLPAHVRDQYREEWAAWMSDLRADRTPRIQRWIELLTLVLIAAPRLAVTLRVDARRAGDR